MAEDHIVLVCCLDAFLVHDTARWCSKVYYSTLPCTVNIVRKGEECIAGARYPIKLRCPLLAFCLGERSWHGLKLALPLQLLASLKNFAGNEEVDGICLFCALDSPLEWQSEYTGMVAQPPKVSLAPSKAGAVNAGLLTSAQADNGTVFCIPNAVGLGVFDGGGSNEQVGQGLLRKLEGADRDETQMITVMYSRPCFE